MIVLDVQQGTAEWQAARLGIPTASQFSRILTTKTRKPSAQAGKYLCELVAERLTGMPMDAASSDFMLRGTALEADAVAAYEYENDCTAVAVGFVLDDSRRWGCSPDRLVGEDGLLEIKCLGAPGHVAALLGLSDDEYFAQVQGQLWVTGRKWCDLYFHNPGMPSRQMRFVRDEEYIAALDSAMLQFCASVDDAYREIVGDGGSRAGAKESEAAPVTAAVDGDFQHWLEG